MSNKKNNYPKAVNKETEIVDSPIPEDPAAIEPEESPTEVEPQAPEAYEPNPIHWKG